jgi:hypothetical protein
MSCGRGSGLGVHRWMIEQTIALPHWFGRLRIRWEIRDDIHEAFMALGPLIIVLEVLSREDRTGLGYSVVCPPPEDSR